MLTVITLKRAFSGLRRTAKGSGRAAASVEEQEEVSEEGGQDTIGVQRGLVSRKNISDLF